MEGLPVSGASGDGRRRSGSGVASGGKRRVVRGVAGGASGRNRQGDVGVTAGDGVAVQPMPGFASALVAWQRRHGRHHLPWQKTQAQLRPGGDPVLRDPYRVWLSEVMLQQTQVATVIPYFEAFLKAFPTVEALAAADGEQVMGLWAGLGYYSRARNLHAAARQVAAAGGRFPSTALALQALPGVGRSTAAAIAVFGFGERAAILDGNVKRVLCRLLAIEGDPAGSAVQKRLWAHAEAELPAPGTSAAELIAYTQGLMDLGAMVCGRTSPACDACPVSSCCRALARGEVARYPTPRQRKPVPLREVHLLWLRRPDDGRVLLAARPDSGLWGGLWSLPELPQQPSADWLPAGEFTHVFTHFRMQARLWAPPVAQAGAMLAALDGDGCGGDGHVCCEPLPGEGVNGSVTVLPEPARRRWVDPAAPGQAPLPAPVRDFFGKVQQRLF